MALTNLKTVLTKTAKVTGVKLAAPADRIGLGFGTATAYPTDPLSPGRFPAPTNPEPEQLRSRHGQSATQPQQQPQMRSEMRAAVPPASSAGWLPPGPSVVRVTWPLTVGAGRSVSTTDLGRNCNPKACVRLRHDRDCQSPVRSDDKRALHRGTVSAATAGK